MKRFIWLWLTVLGLLAGCAQPPPTAIPPTAVPPTETPASLELGGPLRTHWRFADGELWTGPDYNLGLHAIQLTSGDTSIVYTLGGLTTAQLLDRAQLQLVNEKGAAAPLLDAMPLDSVDDLEIGVLRFGGRPGGSRSLAVQITPQDGQAAGKIPVAWLDQPDADGDRPFSRYSASRSIPLSQNGGQITVHNWGLPAGVTPPGPTPAPGKAWGPWAAFAPGLQSLAELTLQLEKPQAKSPQMFSIQFLSGGSVLGLYQGQVIRPPGLPEGSYPAPLAPAQTVAPGAYPAPGVQAYP